MDYKPYILGILLIIILLTIIKVKIGKKNKLPPKENLEIERKFILKDVPVLPGNETEILLIQQIYVKEGKDRTRYRMTSSLDGLTKVYHKCNKKSLSPGVFEEIEEEVTKEVFKKKLKVPHREIIKTRYVYKEGGLKWEIDKYDRMRFVTLEVELDDINQKIKIPKCIADYVIAEVTGVKGFSNYKLSFEGSY